MESGVMDKSKIPVYSTHGAPGKHFSADTNLPGAKKTCNQKIVLPLFSKDMNIGFAPKIPEGQLFKASDRSKQTVSRRTAVLHRGPVARNKVEAELRDRNQLLEAANQHLHAELTVTLETVKTLQEKQQSLEREVTYLNKQLERNMVILESRNIDPVTGKTILDSVEGMEKCRTETKLHTENLMGELKRFSETACKQKDKLQALKSTCSTAEEQRNRFLDKQQAFQEQREKFRQSLKEAEALLDQ